MSGGSRWLAGLLLIGGCRTLTTPAPGEESSRPDEYDEDWVADPDAIPKSPTGVAEIDDDIRRQLGGFSCFESVESGDLDGEGPDDWLLHTMDCATGEVADAILYRVGADSEIVPIGVPKVGAGGRPEFAQMHDGERVLLVDDSCCMTKYLGIAHLRGDDLVLGDVVHGERVSVARDPDGRIVRLEDPD